MLKKCILPILILGCSTAPKPSCEEPVACTREYNPPSCSLGDEEFSGANPCLAQNKARQAACESGRTFQQAELNCKGRIGIKAAMASNTAAPKAKSPSTPKTSGAKAAAAKANTQVKKVPADCQSLKKMCTFEYKPATCTFAGNTFKGSNQCQAFNKIAVYACEKGLAMNEKAVVCKNDSPEAKPLK